tara:strand:+ start:5780 stop:6706 length:927 start_codon:yes stop_codon:yes gene_type:complete
MSSILQTYKADKDYLFEDCQRISKRIKNDWDSVIVNVGIPGTGKTVLSLQMAQYFCETLDCEFDLSTMITYDGAGFLEMLDVNDDETPIILDEAGSALFSQEWQNSVNKAIIQALMVVRKRRKVMILNLPKLRFLNPGVSDRINLFTTVYTVKGRRGYAAVHYPRTTALSNYKYPYFDLRYIHRFPDLDPEIKAQYEPIELEGKEMLLKRYIEKAGGNKLDTLMDFARDLDAEQRDLMQTNGQREYLGMKVFSADLMKEAIENASYPMCRAAAKRLNLELLQARDEKGSKKKAKKLQVPEDDVPSIND